MEPQSNEHLEIGYKIGGHYEITKVLGHGGFGIVYLVKDIHMLDTHYVIKELFSRDFSFRHRDGKSVYNKPQAIKIFTKIKEDIISEVNILRNIRNVNIVKAYGYFEENNTLYSIMEYIDGVDLDNYLKRVSPFSEDEAKDLLLQIINGIKEIHSLNILHRDMKPSNIMKTRDGIYKIIDFTTNRTYVDNQMTTVTAFQSPIYTPPELSGSKRAVIGKFSDIYSIGMTICSVLVRDRDGLPNITDRLIDDSEFQYIIESLDISGDFRAILKKMTEIDADERFQDLEDIEKLIGSRTPLKAYSRVKAVDREPLRLEDEPKPPKKREAIREEEPEEEDTTKSWFATIATVLLIVFTALGFYAYKIVQDDKKRAEEVKREVEVVTYNPKKILFEENGEAKNEEKSNELETPKDEDTPTPTPTQTPTPTPKAQTIDEVETPKEEIIEIVATPKPAKRISLGTMVQAGRGNGVAVHQSVFNRTTIQNFLLQFLAVSEDSSVDNLLSYYSYKVSRYFRLRNVTHREIYKDRVRYNRRWVHREFKLISFEILYRYERGGVEYCEIEKTISYNVISKSSKEAHGVSRVRMTLKNTSSGFKVVSIYSIK